MTIMKTLHTIYTNFAKRVLITLIALTTIGVGTILAAGETGTINFSSSDVKINAASVTAQDNLGNTWTITTVGTTSYTASKSYYQVGSSANPATSITFTTTLPQSVNITNLSAKFGGFGDTAGKITLKVSETVVGSGNLNATNDVTVENTSTATGTVLTVTVTDIARGVKCYYISYTYEIDVPEYNVYWVANNEQISADVVEQGSRVTLPSKPADCSNNVVFVGWTAQNNVNGAKPSDLFNGSTPLLQLPTIDEETTFRAVYAEVVDGVGTFAAGESGTFKLYAIVNGNNYYASTGIDDRKLTSTTAIANAGDYTITHISDDQYTIQYDNQYISHANGKVDLEYLEYNEEDKSKCHWTITRTGTNGTWRVASPVNNDRALVFTTANNNSNVFKAYATENITADGAYYDLEIGNGEAISYQNYTTTCTTDVTVTLDPNGGTGDFSGWDEDDDNYTKTVEKENSVTLPNILEKIGYTFQGWSDGENTYTGQYAPTANVTLTASWKAIDYDITYNLYGGTNHASNPSNYTIETSTITLQAPTKTGYTFGGWYKEDAFTNPVTQIIEGSTGNITLYAKWTPNTYTIQFDANEGTGEMEDQSFTYDAEPTALSANTFTRTGYNFTGWNTADDATGTPYADKAEVQNLTAAANGVVTLHAQWTAKNLINYRTLCTYNIEYTNLEGATHTNPNTYTAADLPLIFTAPSAREGYTFKGWEPATLGTETRGDQEVEAQWQVNSHNLTWDVNGGDALTGEYTTGTVEYGATITKPVDPTRTGYTFAGWGAEVAQTMPDHDLVYTAQWTVNTYTITLDQQGGTGGSESIEVTYDAELPAITIPTREGYTFGGYFISENGVGTQYYNQEGTAYYNKKCDIASAATLYAKWTVHTYTVIYNANNGVGEMNSQSFIYDVEQALNANQFTRVGYSFAGWNDKANGSGNSYADQQVVKNLTATKYGQKTLYAQWTANTNTSYVVKHYKQQLDGTYLAEADDTDNLTGTTASSVTPAVKSYEGFTAPSTQTVSIAADGSTVVTYQYTRNSYNLSWDVNSGDALTGEYTSGSVKYGAAITQPNAPTRTGYTFVGWSPEVPATMPAGDATYTAQWQLIQYTITWSVGGSTTTSTVSVETPLSLPTSPANDVLGCCADAFIGWSVYAQPTKGQVFNDVAKAPVIDGNKTFHAVFATTTLTEGSATLLFNEMGYANAEKVTEIALGDGEGHGDATIVFDKEQSASNSPAYYTASGALHAYAQNTITINSTSATSTITNVQFTFAAKEDGSNTISANVGTYADGTWTGSAESVVFTIGGETGHRKITSITVTTQAVEQYTNYVTKCTYGNSPTLGAATVTYNSGDGIDVRCEQTSTMNKAATLTFPNAADLTCPITLTASAGFLISTSRSNDAGYQTSLTVSPYKSGSAHAGQLRTIYVRANAIGKTENYSGTITISGGEVAEQTITVNANVNCQGYTLTLKDHLGNTIGTPTSHYEGDIIELPTELEEDACSENYTFDGWSTAAVEYGSVAYSKVTFPYTMPAKDVILYPVYQCNKTADYHRVTSDLGAGDVDGNNWAGDYLIAYSDQIFADGYFSGTNEGSLGDKMHTFNPNKTAENLVGDVVKADWGDDYYITLETVEGGYVLKSRDNNKESGKIYNYYTNNTNESGQISVTASPETAAKYAIQVVFVSQYDIRLSLSGNAEGAVFRYGSTGFRFYKDCGGNPIYLYKKSPLYTTSLICGTIETEATPMVTSTAGQTVKVNVPITLTASLGNNTTITGTSDNAAFTVTALNDITAGDHTIAVNYTPTKTTDGIETANITLKASAGNNASTTFQVTGRHLPENFVIAAQWGDNWYALPANCVKSSDSKQGILIDVDDINNPTSATAPTTTKYGLRGVKPGRQADFGQSILFTERVSDNQQRALFQNSEETENIWVSAQYENYDGSNPTYYEWIPTTNDLINYTFTHSASSRKLGVNNNGVFGAYTTDVQVRLLPATFYEQVAVQVIKWKANSVIVMYTGAETTATTQVGTNAATDAQTLANQKITHGIYELTTTQSLTENAGKILTMCFGTTQVKVEVPLIVSEAVIASANGHDVVILNGGKLTAAATSYSYNTIYVYGGGKLAIPEGAQLGVNNIILRAGGVATNDAGQEATYQYIYPQVDLKGTLTSASQTFLKYEYVTDYDHWYHLVLPFNASLSTITYPQEYYGENVKADNKGSWQIKRYAGEIRATGNYDAWKDIETEDATSTTAGKGYIFWGAPKKVTIGGDTQRQKWGIQRITMNKQAATAKNEENSNKKISGLSSYANVANNSGADNDQGWNLVGNPYMVNLTGLNSQSLQIGQLIHETDASGNWTGKWQWDNTSEQTGLRYVTIPSDHFETYEAKPMTWFTESNPMITGRSFFIQIAGEATDLVFDVNKKASLMPALLAENNDKPVDIETGIVLSNETLQDEVNFWIKDGKTNDYEYNADYPKTPNNNRFNIYGVHTNGDLSWVAISPELAAESMPIGYQVPAAGTYTLSVSETYYSDDLHALYVTDHAMSPELTVDLMNAPYEFSVNQAETNNERFTVSIILKTEEDDGGGDVGTGVDNATNNYRPYKFFYQDKLYILRNGIIYDAMGKQVKTINK